MPDVVKSQFRWEDVAATVLRNKRKSLILIAEDLAERYGVLEEVAGGDSLYPTNTTWYFTAPKRS